MVRFTAPELFAFIAPTAGCDSFRAFAHLAFCASAIFRREVADMTRAGLFVSGDVPEPFKDSITEIA
jgi:hypothetical protein